MKSTLLRVAAVVVATSCSDVVAPGNPVRTATLSPDSVELAVGESFQLQLTLLDSAGRPTTGRVWWVSTDSSRVSVTQSGLVQARAPARARIEPWIDGRGGALTVLVKVPGPLAAIDVLPPRDTIIPVDTARFRAVFRDAFFNRLPERPVAWGVADSGIASIDPSGLFTALGPGWAAVYAEAEGVIGVSGIRILPPIASVTLSVDSLTLTPGAQYRPAVTLADARGTALCCRPISWRTEGSGLSVGPDGEVVATGPGSGVAIATAQGHSDTLRVRVQAVSFTAVSAGAGHACGLSDAGEIWCWGRNSSGQLGNGDTIRVSGPMRVPDPATWSAVSAGERHTCALTAGGMAYCWGDNALGQLGNGTTAGAGSPVAVTGGLTFTALAAGAVHTCGLTSAGAAYCWGSALYGRLGDSTGLGMSATPKAVVGGVSFVRLAAGGEHSCGISTGDVLYCWGHASEGQLGSVDIIDRSTPFAVPGGLSWRDASAGARHTCAVTTAGITNCWGQNWFGQLGNGGAGPVQAPGAIFVVAATGERHSCAAQAGGPAYCWGAADRGQSSGTTPTPVGLTASTLSAGTEFTCGLAATGVFCWGSNGYGQLGQGVAGARLVDAMSRTPLRVTGQP